LIKVVYLIHDLKLKEKFITAFSYLTKKIEINSFPKKNFSNLKWLKDKNYNWIILQEENISLLIRQYGTHFTLFYKSRYKYSDNEEIDDYYHTKYGVFVFFTNKEKIKKYDEYIDNNYKDLDKYFKKIIEYIKKDEVWLLSNPVSFKVPKYIEVKNVWNGNEIVKSIDLFTFACEELFELYLKLFSENEMFNKIKTFEVGDKIGEFKIFKIHKKLKNNNYHDVGLTLQGKDDVQKTFHNVYYLTHWLYNEIFK